MDELKEFERAARLLPPVIRQAALDMPELHKTRAEELRLRAGEVPAVLCAGQEICFLTEYRVTPAELQLALSIATHASTHTYADSIKMGYVTSEFGCRLGLCGTAVCEGESIKSIRRLSSICIRIPREKRGCATEVFKQITEKGFASTLVISPPGAGKTTLLRELIRLLSDNGKRVAVVDERSEICGVFEGVPGFDIGAKTDILNAAPKAQGIYMVLRSMSPQVIAFDEITSPEDIFAADAAANCGVELLASAHAYSIEDLLERPLYQQLLSRNIFKHLVIIDARDGKRSYRVESLK